MSYIEQHRITLMDVRGNRIHDYCIDPSEWCEQVAKDARARHPDDMVIVSVRRIYDGDAFGSWQIKKAHRPINEQVSR